MPSQPARAAERRCCKGWRPLLSVRENGVRCPLSKALTSPITMACGLPPVYCTYIHVASTCLASHAEHKLQKRRAISARRLTLGTGGRGVIRTSQAIRRGTNRRGCRQAKSSSSAYPTWQHLTLSGSREETDSGSGLRYEETQSVCLLAEFTSTINQYRTIVHYGIGGLLP